ncbi:MAG: hypothetical protein DRJ09_12300, partial [Bacteroidetes bacterium]
KQQVIDKKGQASAFFFNQYDNKLYFERKLDDRKLGETPLELYQVDVQSSPVQITDSVSLINNGFYVEYDNYNWYGFYYSNLATPYIDPYQNKIYLPNGGHSNVSVVDYTADEALMLKPYDENTQESFTWLSFPRLESADPTVNSVIGGDNIEPNTDPYKYQIGSYLENLPINPQTNTSFITNTFNGTNWISQNGLDNVNATLGYKLSLIYNSNPNQYIKRYLHGNVLTSSASINTLYGNDKENWVGYWLYQQQDIFDALGSTADELNLIKHQDWTCVKTYDHYGPEGSSTIEPFWQCDYSPPIIKYGEMVILKGENDIYNFQWNLFGNPPSPRENLSPEYYSYQEQEDYKPVIIELDSNDHPLEIGAFVNDSCIGATALSADDTMTVIRAYVENDNDTITFQKYYGTKSTGKHVVDDYYVYNRRYKTWHKGFAINNKSKDRFFVSFKKKKTIKPDATNSVNPILRVYPNPAQNSLTIEYLTENENMYFEIFDIIGKKVFKLSEHRQAGLHRSVINTRSLKNGIYLLKLSTVKQTSVKRFVIKR